MLLAPVRLASTLLLLRRQHRVRVRDAFDDFRFFRSRLGITRYDFLTYRLWDRGRPLVERLAYLSLPDRLAIEDLMNPLPHRRATRNKAWVSERLMAAGLPTPEVLAVISTGGGSGTGHRLVQRREELAAFLAEGQPGAVVAKPVFGMKGNDVLAFAEVGPDGMRHFDGRWWSLDRLWRRFTRAGKGATDGGGNGDWMLQRHAAPHPTLAAVHGPTLGCLRMVTFRRDDGRIGLLTPPWKVPVGRSGVDNIGYGSLTAAVDLDTGVVGEPILQGTMATHHRHPDTGAVIAGTVMPHWAEAKRVARDTAAVFPELRSLGIDLGITATGPTIIEVNVYWGPQFMQAPQGRGLVQGEFLAFLEEIGAEAAIRRAARGLPERAC